MGRDPLTTRIELCAHRVCEIVQFGREVDEVCQFGGRSSRDVDEMHILSRSSSCISFNEVCGYRSRCFPHLQPQTIPLVTRKTAGVLVDKKRQRVRVCEHAQLAMVPGMDTSVVQRP